MIGPFQGKYRFLSNFWPAEVILDGLTYPTVEHAYQASKTLNIPSRHLIKNLPTPGKAKRSGILVTMRENWDTVKLTIMYDLVRQKFQNPELARLLVKTGNEELVEVNNWKDHFWGVCGGQGLNHLGRILMMIRKELQLR